VLNRDNSSKRRHGHILSERINWLERIWRLRLYPIRNELLSSDTGPHFDETLISMWEGSSDDDANI
jgi:hypothetical protein